MNFNIDKFEPDHKIVEMKEVKLANDWFCELVMKDILQTKDF